MEHEFESAPRVTTRRTIVVRSIKISGLSVEATLRWLRNVLPEAHTRVRGSCCVALHQGRRRSRGDRPTVVVAASCDPPDVATGPAGGCPPVCQRSEFPHRRNVGIIHYCAVGCKWEREKRAKRTKGQKRENGQDARYPSEPPRWRLSIRSRPLAEGWTIQ